MGQDIEKMLSKKYFNQDKLDNKIRENFVNFEYYNINVENFIIKIPVIVGEKIIPEKTYNMLNK